MPLPEFLAPIQEEGLDADYLDAPVLSQQKSLGAMAKQLVDLDRQRGEQIRVPGKEATDDDWKAFADKLNGRGALGSAAVQSSVLKTLGVPDKADEYALKPEKLPEGLTWDEGAEKFWRDTFHELKVPKGTGAKLMEAFVGRQAEAGKAATEAAQARETAIDTEFGQARDEKLRQIMNAADAYGGTEAVEAMKSAPVSVLKLMSKIADQFNVSGDGKFTSKGTQMAVSPEEASERLGEINKKLLDAKLPRPERQRLEREAVRMQAYKLGQKPDLSMFDG